MAESGLATQRSFVLLNRDFLLYAIFIFPFSSGIFSAGGSAYATTSSGSVLNQAFWPLVFANSVLLAALRKSNLPGLLWALAWLLPLMIWIMASYYWSAFPDLTIRRAGREVIELVGIVLLISTYAHQSEPLRILFLAFLTILFADLASIPFRFSYSEIGFMGIHGHKNGLGGFCFLALPLFALAIFDRRIARWRLTAALALICTVGLLLFSRSKTALGLVGVTSILIFAGWALRWAGRYKGVFGLIYFLIATATTVAVLATGLEETVTLLTGDPTLTGRTVVWQYVLYRWEESPYLGQGYGALWQVGPQIEAYLRHAQVTGWLMNEAHNGYLDVLAQTGIVGLLVLSLFVLSGFFILLFTRQKELHEPGVWKWFAMYVTLGMLLYNITETTFFAGGDWLLFVAMCAFALSFRGYSQAIGGRDVLMRPPNGPGARRSRVTSAFPIG
jgi:exopolysaccharide production protein ExoQ